MGGRGGLCGGSRGGHVGVIGKCCSRFAGTDDGGCGGGRWWHVYLQILAQGRGGSVLQVGTDIGVHGGNETHFENVNICDLCSFLDVTIRTKNLGISSAKINLHRSFLLISQFPPEILYYS